MEETRWKEKNQYLGLTEDGRRVRLLDQSQTSGLGRGTAS